MIDVNAARGRLAHQGDGGPRRQIEDGDPVRRILEVAKDTEADLIVTGTRGLSGLKALMAGSVSHKLMHLAPVTCMAVR